MENKLTDSPAFIKDLFHFLQQDYGFRLIEETSSNSGVFFVYQNEFGKVGISYDYRDNQFDVDLVQGRETPYFNDAEYWKTIKPLESLIKKYDPNFDAQKLQPNGRQYLEALKINAELLQEYGAKVLRGQEWF